MIIDEENIRVQYESTKESPILRDDVLPYPYRYTEKDQIYVVEGVTELTRNEDFSVSYDGSVKILKDIPIGTVLTIYRSTPLDQGSEFPQEAPFSSKKIEDALDKLTMQNQEQREALSRALKLPMTASTDLTDLEMPTPEPNRSVKWNAEGTALVNTNFDPDTALEQTERFKKEAEQAAKDAVAAKESITTTEEILVNTAKQATDEINVLAEETQEAIATASKHKLNSKEIASLLVSSAPQEDSDLALADGRFITSEDDCHGEFHNNYMTTQRKLTDVVTKYYRYDSYNYSRVWYSTVPSVEDQCYRVPVDPENPDGDTKSIFTNIINAPAGTWYLLDREGTPHLKPSIEVKSYYKYELINAVGHDAPQYILWCVHAGDEQLAEPDSSHSEEFYVYEDDVRMGAHIDHITNIVVLPPDATSEYRRIQFTQVEGDNTYYNYYKAEPVEIKAYMHGTVADLNLGASTGTMLQTDASVPKPYLCTTHHGSYDRITNDEFFTTRQWVEANSAKEDYQRFYANLDTDLNYELVKLHDDIEVLGNPTNNAGVFSGFTTTDYIKIYRPFPRQTSFEGVTTKVPITQFELEMFFTTPNSWMGKISGRELVGSSKDMLGLLLGIFDSGHATNAKKVFCGIGDGAAWNIVQLHVLLSKDVLAESTNYKIKLSFEQDTLSLFLAKADEEYELQASTSVTSANMTQYLQEEFWVGYHNYADANYSGKIDLTKTKITLNNEVLWGTPTVAYAMKDGEVLPLSSPDNNPKDYTKEVASNVYETNPEGFTYTGTARITEDGWYTPNAATQYVSLGTALATKAINFIAEDKIDLSYRFRTCEAVNTSSTPNINLSYSVATYGSMHWLYDVDMVPKIYFASTNAAWKVGPVALTGIQLKLCTEYMFNLKFDKTKKYVQNAETKEYEESETGTLYKYEISFTEWSLDEEKNVQKYDYYLDFVFGSGTGDNYQIGTISTWNRAVAKSVNYINIYSFNINGRTLFPYNRNIIDRPDEATALPRIAEKEGGDATYVVVANGVEEEVILANPKKVIDDYTANEITPAIKKVGANIQALLQTNYSNYNKTLTNTYNQGIRALQNASDAVRKSDLQEVYCVVETYVNGYSWYRRWSDGWLEQGGFASAAGVINLLRPYRDTYFTCTATPIAAADPYISVRTIDTITLAGGAAFWKTEGYEL